MKDATRNVLTWAPRILGIVVAAFLGVFAFDAFSENRGLLSSIGAFLIHLVPTYVALGVVYVAWKRAWVGAVTFLLLAGAYAAFALSHPSWIAAISGPLALVGFAYLVSWRVTKHARGT